MPTVTKSNTKQLSFMSKLYNGFEYASPNAVEVNEILPVNLGAVYTRKEIVHFMLDIIGYTSDKQLFQKKILEPAFGKGDFLLPIVSRLVKSWQQAPDDQKNFGDLMNAVRAVELDIESYHYTHMILLEKLICEGFRDSDALTLVNKWLQCGDFLLIELYEKFDFIVGNPPYIRQERIPRHTLNLYKEKYCTIYDRADIYIPFMHRSLLLLNEEGEFSFICSDRWMKNRYGAPIRQLIASDYYLKYYINIQQIKAFKSDVSAYPAITVIANNKPTMAKKLELKSLCPKHVREAKQILLAEDVPNDLRINKIPENGEPWIFDSTDKVSLLQYLENNFPLIEDANCKIRIGVATGADRVFIRKFDELDIEDERKVKLIKTKDIITGDIHWKGYCVVNPFNEDGTLIDLNRYPKLRAYFEQFRSVLEQRHCVKKNPLKWYKTIDRITPSLIQTEKLLVPDFNGRAHIVYDKGDYYPHHNLYHITSKDWDLRALQAVLMSKITQLFISSYSTRMRGGFLRYQAQYLRRICIPSWVDVSVQMRLELREAALSKDLNRCNEAVCKLYSLSQQQINQLLEN